MHHMVSSIRGVTICHRMKLTMLEILYALSRVKQRLQPTASLLLLHRIR